MAQFLTVVYPAFQRTIAGVRADMLSLKCIVCMSDSCSKRPLLALETLALGGLLLSGTATFIAIVSSTIEQDFAGPEALRLLFCTLMTYCLGSRPTTSALDFDCLHAWHTVSGVTRLFVLVSAR